MHDSIYYSTFEVSYTTYQSRNAQKKLTEREQSCREKLSEFIWVFTRTKGSVFTCRWSVAWTNEAKPLLDVCHSISLKRMLRTHKLI